MSIYPGNDSSDESDAKFERWMKQLEANHKRFKCAWTGAIGRVYDDPQTGEDVMPLIKIVENYFDDFDYLIVTEDFKRLNEMGFSFCPTKGFHWGLKPTLMHCQTKISFDMKMKINEYVSNVEQDCPFRLVYGDYEYAIAGPDFDRKKWRRAKNPRTWADVRY